MDSLSDSLPFFFSHSSSESEEILFYPEEGLDDNFNEYINAETVLESHQIDMNRSLRLAILLLPAAFVVNEVMAVE